MARANTKIGDVFSVKLNESSIKFFQYIANDLTQLNSDVIRAFTTEYALGTQPDLLDIVNDEVGFYAHCVTKFGIKMELWKMVGNIQEIGDLNIIFRESDDYGHKVGEEPITISKNWYVWKINDAEFTKVGKLEGVNQKAYVGLVFNPIGILELLKGNKYPINYPDFK
jgi:hypothetical protein